MKASTFSISLFLICIIILCIYSFFILGKDNKTYITSKIIPQKVVHLSEENVSSTLENESLSRKNYDIDTDTKKEEFSGKYKLFQNFVLHDSWQTNMFRSAFTNTWGEENIRILENGSTKVLYPKNSYKPSSSPRGGAGFIYHTGVNRSQATLSYDITLDENFNFVKGGKLPGLCGGNCVRGEATSTQGFSLNFIWKQKGILYITSKGPNGVTTYGSNFNKSILQLEPGKTYNIGFSLTLNTPGKANGILEVYIDRKKVYENTTLVLRDKPDITIDALLFSTFFGGSDESWATPLDTSIIFNNFQIDGK